MAIKNGKKFKPSSRYGVLHKNQNIRNVKALNCYKKVYTMLINGEPITEVARFIQEDAGELPDLSRSTVEAYITKLRDSIPQSDFLYKKAPQIVERAAKKMAEFPDVLEQMTKLLNVQQERLQKTLDTENEFAQIKGSKFIASPQGNQCIKLSLDILNAMHNVQSDLGITPRSLGEMSINVQRESYLNKLPSSMSNISKDQHHKLMAMIERLKIIENSSKQLEAYSDAEIVEENVSENNSEL